VILLKPLHQAEYPGVEIGFLPFTLQSLVLLNHFDDPLDHGLGFKHLAAATQQFDAVLSIYLAGLLLKLLCGMPLLLQSELHHE
jgi:hypothetical protein